LTLYNLNSFNVNQKEIGMSTEQEDAALLLELEEKITRRIREQILICATGYEPAAQDPESTKYSAGLVNDAIVTGVTMKILQNPTFVANLTNAVVQKLAAHRVY
jgi:hypothetical protein